jgi:probable HAF family extracellular repeat protein
MVDLGGLPGSLYGWGYAINSGGTVVGESMMSGGGAHAWLWKNGVMSDLDTLGGSTGRAYGINAAGQIVGYSTTESEAGHAFLWQKGVMIDLNGTATNSIANGIGSGGEIVGISGIHAALWTVK